MSSDFLLADQSTYGITEYLHLPDARVMVSVSIGVTVYPDDAHDANDLLALADRRMYASKGMDAPPAYGEP